MVDRIGAADFRAAAGFKGGGRPTATAALRMTCRGRAGAARTCSAGGGFGLMLAAAARCGAGAGGAFRACVGRGAPRGARDGGGPPIVMVHATNRIALKIPKIQTVRPRPM